MVMKFPSVLPAVTSVQKGWGCALPGEGRALGGMGGVVSTPQVVFGTN